ncbi:hypothetical protein [Bacteroides acidifaciens]|uniref:hypothetical protein n=1 Tax=Bacteroides acidifaciens TaxID=85831 RepID=UPI002557DA9C|nr:hypothetical protein [Bacteroides acidifaciens]
MQINIITPYRQLACLRRNYPDGRVIRQWKDGWAWTSMVQPRPSSPYYNFKIVYSHNQPAVYALDKLELADGENRLPHIYSQQRQRLCLYLPNGIEWNATMPVTKIVPWIAKWFYFYESWVATGVWSGGGLHVTDDAYQQIYSSRTKRRHHKRKSHK